MLLLQQNYFTILNEIEKLPLVTLQSLYELSDVFQSDIADVLSENILKKMMHGKKWQRSMKCIEILRFENEIIL